MNQFCPSPNELTAPPTSGHSGQLTNSSICFGKKYQHVQHVQACLTDYNHYQLDGGLSAQSSDEICFSDNIDVAAATGAHFCFSFL
jgi:hypothetical protein